MGITEIIDMFISENDGYRHNLNNFISYIRYYRKLPLESTVFGGITTTDVIQSLEYNINRGQFKSVSIAQKYSVAVAQFFVYAIFNGYIKNIDLREEISAPKIDEKSYYSRINTYISKNKKLREKKSITEFSSEVIDEIVMNCDAFIESSGLHKNKKGFEKVAATICIKLILLTGVKYGVARKIKLNHINAYSNVVDINGFKIRLPLKLSTQFQYYLKLREELHHISTESHLFVSYDGSAWKKATSSSKITTLLAQWTGRTDTTGLTSFGIRNLIEAGVNDSIITKLTGAEETLIKSCICLNEDDKAQNWDKYINSRIHKIDFYYKL